MNTTSYQWKVLWNGKYCGMEFFVRTFFWFFSRNFFFLLLLYLFSTFNSQSLYNLYLSRNQQYHTRESIAWFLMFYKRAFHEELNRIWFFKMFFQRHARFWFHLQDSLNFVSNLKARHNWIDIYFKLRAVFWLRSSLEYFENSCAIWLLSQKEITDFPALIYTFTQLRLVDSPALILVLCYNL